MKREEQFYTVRGYQQLNSGDKVLTSSMEDYLEMIYRTCMEEGYVRINQLSDKLNVRPSSTTKIVQKLRELGLVNYQKYGIIQLTVEGKSVGDFLLKRHGIIEKFLTNIGVGVDAFKDTELIEHDISPSTLHNMHIFNRFLDNSPTVREEYNQYRANFSENNNLLYKE